jgi:hypothetical protein
MQSPPEAKVAWSNAAIRMLKPMRIESTGLIAQRRYIAVSSH